MCDRTWPPKDFVQRLNMFCAAVVAMSEEFSFVCAWGDYVSSDIFKDNNLVNFIEKNTLIHTDKIFGSKSIN